MLPLHREEERTPNVARNLEFLAAPLSSAMTRMERHVTVIDDLKTAVVLGGSAGLFGAVTVPILLPAAFDLVPPDQRTLPMPLSLFCVLLAIQLLVVYGLFALAGLRVGG